MIDTLNINIHLNDVGFIQAGSLDIDHLKKESTFTYNEAYISNQYPTLNPLTLNYKESQKKSFTTNIKDNPHYIDNTFLQYVPNTGSWSDNLLSTSVPKYSNMNFSEKLLYLENITIGAIQIYKDTPSIEFTINTLDNFELIYFDVYNNNKYDTHAIHYLGYLNYFTVFGGDRAKILLKDDDGYWIVNLPNINDHYNINTVQNVIYNMLYDIGIDSVEQKNISLSNGDKVVAFKRFDRNFEKYNYNLRLSTLTKEHKNYNISEIIKNFSIQSEKDNIKIMSKFLFDIGTNNTYHNILNHTHLFLNHNNAYQLAPFYHFAFNPIQNNHHHFINGVNYKKLYLDNPKLNSIISKTFNVKESIVEHYRAKIFDTLSNYEFYCHKHHVTPKDTSIIANSISVGLFKNHKPLLINKKENRLRIK